MARRTLTCLLTAALVVVAGSAGPSPTTRAASAPVRRATLAAPRAPITAAAIPAPIAPIAPPLQAFTLGDVTITQTIAGGDPLTVTVPVEGVLAQPNWRGQDNARFPVAVLLHDALPVCGASDAEVWPCEPQITRRDYLGYRTLAQALALRGYVVLMPNLGAEYTPALGPAPAGLRAGRILDRVLEWAADGNREPRAQSGELDQALRQADLGRITLIGHGRGAAVALAIARERAARTDPADAPAGRGPVSAMLLLAPMFEAAAETAPAAEPVTDTLEIAAEAAVTETAIAEAPVPVSPTVAITASAAVTSSDVITAPASPGPLPEPTTEVTATVDISTTSTSTLTLTLTPTLSVPDIPIVLLLAGCSVEAPLADGQALYRALREDTARKSLLVSAVLHGADRPAFNAFLFGEDALAVEGQPACAAGERLSGPQQRAFAAAFAPDALDIFSGVSAFAGSLFDIDSGAAQVRLHDQNVELSVAPPPALAPGTWNIYSLGEIVAQQDVITESLRNYPLRVEGGLAVPAGDGPFPVALMLHLRSENCAAAFYAGDQAPMDPWPCPPAATPRYDLGYGYLGEEMARRGYIFLTLNLVGAFSESEMWGGGVRDSLDYYRVPPMVDKLFETLAAANRGESGAFGFDLAGKVDLSRIALVGHSRGGEWANLLANRRAGNTSPDDIAQGRGPAGAVFLLTPSIHSFTSSPHHAIDDADDARAAAAPLAVVVSACDRDLRDEPFQGQQYYEWARLDAQRENIALSIALTGGEHYGFNTRLPGPEYNPNAAGCDQANPADAARLLTPEAERAFLSGILPDFLDASFGPAPESALAMLDPTAPFTDTLYGAPAAYSLLSPAAQRRTLVLPPADAEVVTNTLGGPVSALGAQVSYCAGTQELRCILDATAPYSNVQPTFSGYPPQIRLTWDALGAGFQMTLPETERDVSRYGALHLRVLVDPLDPRNAVAAQPFSVALSDAAGNTARVALPRALPPLQRPAGKRTSFGYESFPLRAGSIRVPLSEFQGITLTEVSTVELRFDQTGRGSILLSDLEFVAPRAAWPDRSVTAAGGYRIEMYDDPCSAAILAELPAGAAAACGRMRVPENRSVSGGPAVEIPYAIVKSASPRPDALIYLGDGPGASALAGMSDVLGWLQPFIAERDLIVFDPRGTDLASPALDCLPAFATPDLSQARREAEAAAPPALLPLTDADVRAYACGQRLAGQGIDLAQYGAAQQALDLADLMQALGYAEYNVYAAGYGTRVALEAMRVKPAGLRAAVLDSVLPAQARPDERGPALAAYETALTTLTQCGADPTCQAAFPYIRYRFYKVKDALTRSPLTLTVESPSAFTGEDLTRFLIATGATAAYAPYLPLVIDELERGSADTLTGLLNGQIRPRGAPAAPAAQRNLDAVRDFTTRFQQAVQAVGLDDAALRELGRVLRRSPDRGQLAAFVTAHLPQDEASLLLSQLASLSDQDVELAFTELAGGARQPYLEGAYLAAWCQDAMPNQSLERAQDAYRAAGIPGDLASVDLEAARSAWARCALFTAGQSMTVTRTLPVTSDVPALVLQGLMDTSTAAAWSATARRTLSNSLGVDFPLQGRIVIAQPASQITGCPAIIAGAFLDQPDVPPDAACAGLDYQINWVVK